jgi:hypothetical protein
MPQQVRSSGGPASGNTALLNITIAAFYPIGAIYPLGYTLALTGGDPGKFSFANNKLTVRVAAGTPVQIQYQLNDPAYVLVGIAFKPVGAPGAGRLEFPVVTATRTPTSSTLVVQDANLANYQGIDFSYVIVVQQVATGFIGIIDPDIENDPV